VTQYQLLYRLPVSDKFACQAPTAGDGIPASIELADRFDASAGHNGRRRWVTLLGARDGARAHRRHTTPPCRWPSRATLSLPAEDATEAVGL
jgi:hypothetical protein